MTTGLPQSNENKSKKRTGKYLRLGRLMLAASVIVLVATVIGMAASGVLRQSVTQPDANATLLPSTRPAALHTAADYIVQGDYDFDFGNYTRAITDYTHAIVLNPASAQAYNNRAYTYMKLEQYAPALTDLDQAIRLRPNYINALMNRADIHNYYYQIDYVLAVRDYDRVLALDPSAAQHTSVCGHRMLAIHAGWHLSVIPDLLTGKGINTCAGAPSAS